MLHLLKYSHIIISIMPKQCALCGKKYISSVTLVKLRGKYNPTAKSKKHPNLQWVRLASDVKLRGGHAPLRGKRVKACVKCIRTLHKTK